MTHEIINYGFRPDTITIDQYVLGAGAVPKIELQKDGDWSAFLPEFEAQQRHGIETFNCTGFGTLNIVEMLKRRIYGETINYSDRALGIVAGTDGGNTPHFVAETIRKVGLVDEKELPFDSSIKSTAGYYQPKPLPKRLLDKAAKWLTLYDFMHEWVFASNTMSLAKKQARIREAIKYSPLGVSVYGWVGEDGLYRKPEGVLDNHWCVLYKINDNGTYQVFDSYDASCKTLIADYDFMFCKRYHLSEKVLNAPNYESQLNWALQLAKQLLSLLTLGVWKR